MRASTLVLPALRARRSGLAGVYRRRLSDAREELERRHSVQRTEWAARSADFPAIAEAIRPHVDGRFVQADWAHYQRQLEHFLAPRPRFDFLSSTTLRDTMVMVTGGRRFAREMKTCSEVWGAARLAQLAEEDLAGDPVLHSRELLSSHTRIHHLHHLARYERARGRGLDETPVTLEWGGGFGSMARLMRRMAGSEQTLVLVDLPIMCALQWLYLGVTIGADAVHLVDRAGAGIAPGRINVVPNGLLGEITVAPDVFISTWALGESEPAAQELCLERGWLDAPRMLIADQRTHRGTENSDRLLDLVTAPDTKTEAIATVPGSYYVFR